MNSAKQVSETVHPEMTNLIKYPLVNSVRNSMNQNKLLLGSFLYLISKL